MPVVSEVTHHMALVPLLWLGVLAYYGQRRSPAWWALALVLSVSWLADTAAHWVNPWLVSAIYPMAQAVLLAAVLVPNPGVWRFAGIVAAVGGLAFASRGIVQPDVFLHTVAWAGLLVVAWPQRPLRPTVVATFGVGWIGWLLYSIAPTWETWGLYQGIRAFGIGLLCWATAPQLARAR